ncbi:MAG TPA: hypothetical protein VFR87_02505 [Nocardioidaceae bacterium]|nr:hypothetical protein [Nocardioidaceae bacterium]
MSTRHRLTDLLGMQIRFADGQDGDRVIDVRLAPSARVPGPLAELVVEGLIVGRMRPGTLFGYDRHPEQGPWMIRTVVRFLHRHTGYLTWDDVDRVDWEARVVHVRTTGLREATRSS